MTNEVALIDPQAVEHYTPGTVDIIRRTIAPNLTMDELNVFLHNCMRTGLDPMAKQIYAIKRAGRMCIQTGIDGFRLIAERTGKYSPGKDTEFLYDDKGTLLGAKVYVKKMTPDGTWHDISATALLREYNPGQGLWGRMPHVMIEKCAEARALRRAFPADLSGLYTDEEMEQASDHGTPTAVIETAPEPIISEDTWKALDDYLNGHDDLRNKLKQLCRVNDLRNIKQSQLEACRNYAKTYMQREKVAEEKTEK